MTENQLAAKSPADKKIDEFCEAFRKELGEQSVRFAFKRKADTVEVEHVEAAARRILFLSKFGPDLNDLMIE